MADTHTDHGAESGNSDDTATVLVSESSNVMSPPTEESSEIPPTNDDSPVVGSSHVFVSFGDITRSKHVIITCMWPSLLNLFGPLLVTITITPMTDMIGIYLHVRSLFASAA